jgi:hypothetical protein
MRRNLGGSTIKEESRWRDQMRRNQKGGIEENGRFRDQESWPMEEVSESRRTLWWAPGGA